MALGSRPCQIERRKFNHFNFFLKLILNSLILIMMWPQNELNEQEGVGGILKEMRLVALKKKKKREKRTENQTQ